MVYWIEQNCTCYNSTCENWNDDLNVGTNKWEIKKKQIFIKLVLKIKGLLVIWLLIDPFICIVCKEKKIDDHSLSNQKSTSCWIANMWKLHSKQEWPREGHLSRIIAKSMFDRIYLGIMGY